MDLSLSNPFAALEVRKTKKKKQSDSEKKKKGPKSQQNLRLEQEIFGKRQSNVSDWADDDEWGTDPALDGQGNAANGKDPHSDLHDSEEEIDLEEHFGVELGPEDDHEEHEEKEKHQTKPSAEELALLEEHRKRYHVQPQRKVSKKELKKKEMEDLDDLLADLGIDVGESQKGQESSNKKKKKKSKEKSGVAGEEPSLAASADQNQAPTVEEPEEEAPSSLTPDEIRNKLEKTKGTKKRTTSKKCIEIAAAEAKARNKGKKGKRDSTHYNQAPNH